MIASSILTSRALAPVELAIANWKGFVAARQGWAPAQDAARRRARAADAAGAAGARGAAARRECRHRRRPAASASPSRTCRSSSRPAAGLGIIGPSASGKSSLARMLVGVWPAWRGKVRLDGGGARAVAAGGSRAGTSATCRRTWSCLPARWRRTSPASTPSPTRRR